LGPIFGEMFGSRAGANVILGIGGLNVFIGIYSSRKLVNCRTAMYAAGANKKEQIENLTKQFEVISLKKDGKLRREDLGETCLELNLVLTETELSALFDALDEDHKGVIDLADFEKWWYSEGLFCL